MSLPVQDKCVHCNLSLSSNLSANAPSHPLSSCSSSSFTSSCSTSLPSVLLSSLSRSPRPSFFFLSPPPPHLSPRHSSPRGTWSRPAVTESHLVCSPLRLPDTQHPHRGLRWRQVEELMKPSALCMNTPLLSWQSANIWAHESLNYNSVRDCM